MKKLISKIRTGFHGAIDEAPVIKVELSDKGHKWFLKSLVIMCICGIVYAVANPPKSVQDTFVGKVTMRQTNLLVRASTSGLLVLENDTPFSRDIVLRFYKGEELVGECPLGGDIAGVKPDEKLVRIISTYQVSTWGWKTPDTVRAAATDGSFEVIVPIVN